jgi:hypothetical protein
MDGRTRQIAREMQKPPAGAFMVVANGEKQATG